MIAFVGSVFSPWYRRERASGHADPMRHCAINVALHGPDGTAWVFTEKPREAIHRAPERFELGRGTSLEWQGDELVITIDEATKPFFQRMPPRVRGTVRIRPHALFGTANVLDPEGRQRWFCVAPESRFEAEFSAPALRFSGRAYHDSNQGEVGLEYSFRSWHWSRAPLESGTAVLYDTIDRTGRQTRLGRLFHRDGRVEPIDPASEVELGAATWGVGRAIRSDDPQQTRVVDTLEASPFYARSIVQVALAGQTVRAFHESLDLERFRAPWVQFLLPWRIRRELSASQGSEEGNVS